MLLVDRYSPKSPDDLDYNRGVMDELLFVSQMDNIPHIIICGPVGSGKKTMANFFLENLYDSSIYRTSPCKYDISGSYGKKQIMVEQSNNHAIIDPNNVNHDKHILHDMIKIYASRKSVLFATENIKHKTVLINNVELLSSNSQGALHRTMEKYTKQCRFLLLCNDISKLDSAIRSRCSLYCSMLPEPPVIRRILARIIIEEQISITNEEIDKYIETGGRDLRSIIWMLEHKKYGVDPEISVDKVFDTIVNTLVNIKQSKTVTVFDMNIRTKVYSILIANITETEIISTIMDSLIKRINNDNITDQIIQAASESEYNMIHGRRAITGIDKFIATVISIIRSN